MEPKEAEELAKKIVSLGMTVKDAASSNKPKTTKNKTKPKNRDLLNIEEELSENHWPQNPDRSTICLTRKNIYLLFIKG